MNHLFPLPPPTSMTQRPPLAPLDPHQPRPALDASHPLERGGVVAGEGRVHEGARTEESDSAGGMV